MAAAALCKAELVMSSASQGSMHAGSSRVMKLNCMISASQVH